MLGTSVLSFLLALTVSSILSMLTTALAITASFTLLILANVYALRLRKRAAGFLVVLASLVLWLVWTLLPALEALNIRGFFKGQLIYPEWLVCLLIFAACAVFGKKPADKLFPHEDS